MVLLVNFEDFISCFPLLFRFASATKVLKSSTCKMAYGFCYVVSGQPHRIDIHRLGVQIVSWNKNQKGVVVCPLNKN